MQEAKKNQQPQKTKPTAKPQILTPRLKGQRKQQQQKGILWFRSVSQKEHSLWIWNYPVNKIHSPLTPNYVKPANTTIKKKKKVVFSWLCVQKT